MNALPEPLSNLAARGYASLLLGGMSILYRVKPELRRHLGPPKGVNGSSPFKAEILFRTRDGRAAVTALFRKGRMSIRPWAVKDPQTSFIFRDAEVMRAFLNPKSGADPLHALLDGDLVLDGNLSYMLRFSHLSELLGNGGEGEAQWDERIWAIDETKARKIEHQPKRGRLTLPQTDRVELLEEPCLAKYGIEDFPRLKALRERQYVNPAEICVERPRLLTEYFKQHGFETDVSTAPVLRQARALKHVLSHKAPIIREDDLIAGSTTSKPVGVIIYPEFGGVGIWPELTNMQKRALNPYRISAEDAELLDGEILPFWQDRCIREWARKKYGNPLHQRLDERWVLYFQWKTQAVSHTVPGYPKVLARGLGALIAEARERGAAETDREKKEFYEAAAVAMEGAVAYAARLAEEAERQSRRTDISEERRAELTRLAEICRRVPAGPARTLDEAVNSIWITEVCLHQENMNAGLSIGRLDRWLQPFFAADMKKARSKKAKEATVRRAVELLGCLFLKCSDHTPMAPDLANRLFGGSPAGQVVTIGGVDEKGETAVNDMTYVILKAAELMVLNDPNLNARFHPGVNSPEYLKRLCEVNYCTSATPSLHNDKVIVEALINEGFAPEDARDWSATGCVEPTSCGRHFGHTNCMMFNMVAPLEMALRDGFHPLIRERFGPRTGDPKGFKSFEEFYQAYLAQLFRTIDLATDCNNMYGLVHRELHPIPLLSSLIEGPMEEGRDLTRGSAKYNSSGIGVVGLADVVDSLTAVKTIVFDKGYADMETLLAALDADFKGHETLLARIRKEVPRYGTDEDAPTSLARRVMADVYERFHTREHYRGGRYVSGFWSMSNHVAFGLLSGALPSGRLKGEPFSAGATPRPGATDNLLSNIRAVAALDPLKMPNNMAFNVRLAPGPRDEYDELINRFAAYVGAYFELGGMQMQLNVVSAETLRDAQARPECYRDLMVRISGYLAYFVELNADMQEELISRTEYAL